MSTLALFRIMVWAHLRGALAHWRAVRKQSRLLLAVLALFILGYLAVGYGLFYAGLHYLYHFPLVGALLSQRILFLVFGFTFVMLVFSNLIIGYSTLFKNRETEWMLSLPLRHEDVYRWKFLESLAISSWALMFLSAPMMFAYGHVHRVHPAFYLQAVAACVPFVVLPGLIGSWMALALARLIAKRWFQRVLLASAVLAVLGTALLVRPANDAANATANDLVTFDQLLRHSRMSLSPALPSAWLARCVMAWAEGLGGQGVFYFLLLASYALMGLLIGMEFFARRFYSSWTEALARRAERARKKAEARKTRRTKGSLIVRILDALPGGPGPLKAITAKDARVFWRDPAQWTQFMIFFGLLCIYALNLRNISFNFRNEFWEMMISYLNLTASALTLSTLTTRFVFPQFSLEGRRLWIIGLAPISLRSVLAQKLATASAASMAVTVTLMTASSLMLRLPWDRVLFFATAIAAMSITLSSLAVGLGALFPNLREDNPSKIVSGFGGTLCLVLSFVYIASFVALLAVPAIRAATPWPIPLKPAPALALAALISLATGGIPVMMAMRRVKNLEF